MILRFNEKDQQWYADPVLEAALLSDEVVCDFCNELFGPDDRRTGGYLHAGSWAVCPECVKRGGHCTPDSGDRVNLDNVTFFDFVLDVRSNGR